MPQVILYVDKEFAERLDKAARRAGKSRSAWAREKLARDLEEPGRGGFPQWWWDNLGKWQDTRTSDEIIADIDAGLVLGPPLDLD